MHMTSGEAAKALHVSQRTVLRLVHAGDLKGLQLYRGAQVAIDPLSVIAYVQDHLDVYSDDYLATLERLFCAGRV